MLAFIAKSEGDQVVLMTMTLWAMIIGYIEMFQATLHSIGIDLVVWARFTNCCMVVINLENVGPFLNCFRYQ